MRTLRTAFFFASSLAATALMLSAAEPSLAVEELTVAQAHAAYRARTVTVTAVVQAHLDRIAAYDQQGPVLNAIVNTHPDALADAATMDAALAQAPVGELPPGAGPLWGIPVIVKDNIDAVGVPMTSGFQGWKNYNPPTDAPLVAQIKRAGGIILAKASLSEFARGGGDNINSVLPGFARNPYHTLYATGGSSGGTGAALAAGFGVLGLGTDTGGSVRMPAAHNALAGLRPTVGLVSRTGVVPLDGVRDTAGPMARTVTDLAILLEVIAAPDANDTATTTSPPHRIPVPQPFPQGFTPALRRDALRGARLGVLRQVFRAEVTDPAILANFERTLAELRSLGADIIDPLIVPELDTIPRPPQTPSSFQSDMARWFAAHPDVPYGSVQALADSGLLHPLHQAATEAAAKALPAADDPRTREGRANEQRFREAFTAAMAAAGVDALVFPTWAQLPARNGDRNTQLMNEPKPDPAAGPVRLRSSLTFVGSMLQWPAISVPNGFIEGLPVGLQMVAPPWQDARLIGYAFAYEQATGYRAPPLATPPLSGSLSHRFVGTWELVEIRERDPATGRETPAARRGIAGQLVYAPNQRLSVQIIREGREQVPAGSSDGFSSYFGTWQIDAADGCVIHHQTGHLNQAQAGQAARRYYSFSRDGLLSLATPPRARDAGGAATQAVFVWRRLP